jgi:hypothetical protein
MSRILFGGAPFYMFGANYPWMIEDGKSNYGLDFGVNRWGTHQGVSTNLERVEKDFAEMEALGLNTLRWFVFTDGRGGITFDEEGMPLRVSDKFFEDMDAALHIARSHNVRIIFVLLDFLWMHDAPQPDSPTTSNYAHVLRSHTGHTRLVENVFIPIFQRYANHQNVLAWEVMNEPDWVVDGLDVNTKNVVEPISLKEFRYFVRLVADAVHSFTNCNVTVGGGRIRFVDVWDDDELAQDFLQVHTYNDFLNQKWDAKLFGKNYRELNLKRPLLIGEFSTNSLDAFENTKEFAPISIEEYLSFCHDQNYAGSLFWSFNAVDKCGTEDRSKLREWSRRNLFSL